MTIREIRGELKKSPMSAWYFIQGSVRFLMYQTTTRPSRPRKWTRWMLRKHIIEQYDWRRFKKANKCYMRGSCLCCKCKTPALFFANKSCSVGKLGYEFCEKDGLTNCYPRLMSRKEWNKFKQTSEYQQ